MITQSLIELCKKKRKKGAGDKYGSFHNPGSLKKIIDEMSLTIGVRPIMILRTVSFESEFQLYEQPWQSPRGQESRISSESICL